MTAEHLDVLIIGAGLSGISAGHYVQAKTPWASYAILEGRDAIGGTWDLFRYPGIRSDSDMLTLGYSFRPWTGTNVIADGESVRTYIEETAREEGIIDHIRFGCRVTAASWSTPDARWTVTVERTDTTETYQLTAGFIISCTGYYRYDHGHEPDFAGIDTFAGTVVHPQHWPEDLDYRGKRVIIVGSGATAITLAPAMAQTAGHVTMLQRSPTYVTSTTSRFPFPRIERLIGGHRLGYLTMRLMLATMGLVIYLLCQRFPTAAKRVLRKGQERALPADFDIDRHLTPTYNPWDQRVCVDSDGKFFAALSDGRADIVTDQIESFTANGIALQSGTELEADIVVTATGLEMLFLGGIELDVDGIAVDPAERLVYKGMMIEGVPNLAISIGYTNASWTLRAELICQYVTRLLTRLRDTGNRQCTPIASPADVDTRPLLPLASGYVQRAASQLPKQGRDFPWRVHQNYLRDFRAMRLGVVDDAAMRFSNRAPAPISISDRAAPTKALKSVKSVKSGKSVRSVKAKTTPTKRVSATAAGGESRSDA